MSYVPESMMPPREEEAPMSKKAMKKAAKEAKKVAKVAKKAAKVAKKATQADPPSCAGPPWITERTFVSDSVRHRFNEGSYVKSSHQWDAWKKNPENCNSLPSDSEGSYSLGGKYKGKPWYVHSEGFYRALIGEDGKIEEIGAIRRIGGPEKNLHAMQLDSSDRFWDLIDPDRCDYRGIPRRIRLPRNS